MYLQNITNYSIKPRPTTQQQTERQQQNWKLQRQQQQFSRPEDRGRDGDKRKNDTDNYTHFLLQFNLTSFENSFLIYRFSSIARADKGSAKIFE